MLEDFYLPVRGAESGTSIEPLAGVQFDAIQDIEYLRNRLLGSLKIPKAYIGFEEDTSGKATLAAEDIRMTIRYLSNITGVITVDEILGEIFSNFCIGK